MMQHGQLGLLLFLLRALASTLADSGNEKTPYPQPTYADVMAVKKRKANATVSYRQDLCDRYKRFRDGSVSLRNALQGLELRPFLFADEYFHYNDTTGIDPDDPGFLAQLMDELSRRAGFTWRNSFGVVHALPERPPDAEDDDVITYTDVLSWSANTYDLSASWWDATLERMELGVNFQHPWFDGSIIMIQKEPEEEVDHDNVDVWNWLRPFAPEVWYCTVGTIIFSGLAYQWLEHLNGQRNDRSLLQWFSDNVYLSAIAFPQNYEFQPRSAAGRLFGVSISLWALVMTATYTANLASLLVDTTSPPIVVEQFSDVITMELAVCVFANTGADAFIKQKYRQARRVLYPSELETYQALQDGTCDITLAYYRSWEAYKSQKAYNPECDLRYVGRPVKSIQSGFANLADVGGKCTSLIGYVFNIYFNEMQSSGYLDELWDQFNEKKKDIDCAARSAIEDAPAENSGRRKLMDQFGADQAQRRRRLAAGSKGGAAGAAAVVQEQDDASQMTMNQMAGTFILHFWVTALAVIVGYICRYYNRRHKELRMSYVNTDKSDRDEWQNEVVETPESTRESARKEMSVDEYALSKESPKGAWQATQKELQATRQELHETKEKLQQELHDTKEKLQQELQDTRMETKKQLDLILKLLMNSRPEVYA